MGNRAVLTWGNEKNFPSQIGVYLHWNGGPASVKAFLTYCKLKGHREPDRDCYGYARLCQVIGNFFGGTTSIGIDLCRRLDCDNGDNGLYFCKGWEVVGRKFDRGIQDDHDLVEFLLEIDANQPPEEQIGEAELLERYRKMQDLA